MKTDKKIGNLIIPRAIILLVKRLGVAACGRQLCKSALILENKISYLVEFLTKRKKTQFIGQILPQRLFRRLYTKG